jgi:hypothetical protein
MFKKLKHKFGIHDWKGYPEPPLFPLERVCTICEKREKIEYIGFITFSKKAMGKLGPI